jgi:sporulation protein YabP
MAEERTKAMNYRHNINLLDREYLEIEGVSHVESFDDEQVVLATNLGILEIKGEELHIKQLNLDQGKLTMEGAVKSLAYQEEGKTKTAKGKGKNLLSRILD